MPAPSLLPPAQPRAGACGPSRQERRREAGQTSPQRAPAGPPEPPATSPRGTQPRSPRPGRTRRAPAAPGTPSFAWHRLRPSGCAREQPPGYGGRAATSSPGPSRSPRPATARPGQATTFRQQSRAAGGAGRCRRELRNHPLRCPPLQVPPPARWYRPAALRRPFPAQAGRGAASGPPAPRGGYGSDRASGSVGCGRGAGSGRRPSRPAAARHSREGAPVDGTAPLRRRRLSP